MYNKCSVFLWFVREHRKIRNLHAWVVAFYAARGRSEAGGALLVFFGIILIGLAVSLIGRNIENVQIFNLLCILQVMVSFIGNMKSWCRKGLFRNMGIL